MPGAAATGFRNDPASALAVTAWPSPVCKPRIELAMTDNENGDHFLEIRDASRSFVTPEGEPFRALESVSLSVRNNEFVTLLGPSGCGKTTLLRTISGLEDLDHGEIAIDGRSMIGIPPHRRPVNTVFQNYALFPHLSVGDNVGYSLDVARVAKPERNRRVGEALDLVGLAGMERRRPRQLSGGQQQRVALARAIISNPKLLLLDEPLSALDRGLRQAMQIELKNIQSELGISFVFVTHDQEEALTMSDRIVVMRSGRIEQVGTPTEVYDRPKTAFVAEFVGESNIFRGERRRNADGESELAIGGGQVVRLRASDADTGDAGDSSLLIRPEHLSVADPGETPDPRRYGALDATLRQAVFLGTDFQLICALADGTAVKAIIRDTARRHVSDLRPGDPVRLHYWLASPYLIPGEGGE
jgi:spermidine/putrescine transport system ATP-binding protein